MKRIIALTALVLAGCASSGTQVNQSSLPQFQKGITTEADVETALGKPQTTGVASDGTRSIAYIYTATKVKGATFVPIVGLFAGGATGQTNVVTFHFDGTGKLLDYSTNHSDIDVRNGTPRD
jgi:outer membrane protein assembly factor BamE (lipoprotein component of BamABCDE complex)